MRFFVLGASGMAGHTISLYLKECGHEVVGFSRRPVSFLEKQVNGDARDVDLLSNTVASGEFDVVVNAIGVLNAFAEADPDGAAFLNGELPHVLASMTANMDTCVFHMSTDCVFAGNGGPYTEDSAPDGESVYDRTKAAGELNDRKNLTFRNSIVGPDNDPKGIGLLNWFMAQKGPIQGYKNAIWTGMTTLELAKAMATCAIDGSTGLVNMVPDENISKYELLQLFNKYFRGGSVDVEPFENKILDKTLERTNFQSAFRPASYEKQISDLAEWVRNHIDFYPHYEMD